MFNGPKGPHTTGASADDGKNTVRHSVKKLLSESEAFRALGPKEQREFANNMVKVADFLARPMGIKGNKIPGGLGMPARTLADETNQSAPEATFEERMDAVNAIGNDPFQASAAREGAEVAGLLLDKVNFSDFVGGLIQNVFQAIVTSSMKAAKA